MQLNFYPNVFGGWTTEPPSELIGPGGASRQHEREVFLAGLAYRPESSTLIGNKGMKNPNDGLRPDESSAILQAKIETGGGLDVICQRVAQIYNKR